LLPRGIFLVSRFLSVPIGDIHLCHSRLLQTPIQRVEVSFTTFRAFRLVNGPGVPGAGRNVI